MGDKLNTYGLGCFGFLILTFIYLKIYAKSLGGKSSRSGKGSSSDNFHYFND